VTLLFDRRDQFAGAAMCHAFLVGVSNYSHLPGDNEPPKPAKFNLKKLASPALSAWRLARWLIENGDSFAQPLGSVRVLISPSPREEPLLDPLPALPGIVAAQPDPADWAHFVPAALAWRADAARHKEGMTFFYYAGHGLERMGGTVLTLEDFTDPNAGGLLIRSFDLNANFVAGMGPTDNRPDMALKQFYFIDSCREQIEDKTGLRATPGDVWDALSDEDDRATPVFMATFPGSVAQARAGQLTDFAEALLKCFQTGAEIVDLADPQRRWPVSSFTLNNALERHFKDLATGQYTTPTGMSFKDITLRWLDQAPMVDFAVQVHPDAAIDFTTVTLSRAGGGFQGQFSTRQNHPFRVSAPAGIFAMQADGGDRFARFEDTQTITQRQPVWPISMKAAP